MASTRARNISWLFLHSRGSKSVVKISTSIFRARGMIFFPRKGADVHRTWRWGIFSNDREHSNIVVGEISNLGN